MSRLMLRSTMKWLLERLGKVQLPPLDVQWQTQPQSCAL